MLKSNKNAQPVKKLGDSRVKLNISRTFAYLLLVLVTVMCLFSFVVLIINSSRSNSEIQQGFNFTFGKFFKQNLDKLLANKNLPVVNALGNSLLIASVTAILTTYFSAMTAYAIHIYNFKLKNAAHIFILLVMMVPTQVSSLGFLKLAYSLKMVDTFWPLILPSIAAPVVYFFMKQYMESVLPFEMIEAARVDGSGELRTFHTIVLPIMKPALAVQGIFSFVTSWNNLFMPSLIIRSTMKRTLPLLIAQLQAANPDTFDLGVVYMLMTLAIVPLLIMYLILSKFIIRGITLGSVKG